MTQGPEFTEVEKPFLDQLADLGWRVITVDRGGELVVSAPEDCSRSTMAAFVRGSRPGTFPTLVSRSCRPVARAPDRQLDSTPRSRSGGVRVLDLGFRWGSCGKRGLVNFHWAVILLPPRIIDYVIVHELVHLHEQHHTPAFWRRLERAMPDYDRRKEWLARRGGAHLAL